ncbi:unnamed protein product, partial [Candidula unifasciata]
MYVVRLSIYLCANIVVTRSPRRRPKSKKSSKQTQQPPNQVDLSKGNLINDVRNSSDVTQAVRDRLCLWPTGGEMVALLMLLKVDHMCTSFRPTAVTPP